MLTILAPSSSCFSFFYLLLFLSLFLSLSISVLLLKISLFVALSFLSFFLPLLSSPCLSFYCLSGSSVANNCCALQPRDLSLSFSFFRFFFSFLLISLTDVLHLTSSAGKGVYSARRNGTSHCLWRDRYDWSRRHPLRVSAMRAGWQSCQRDGS